MAKAKVKRSGAKDMDRERHKILGSQLARPNADVPRNAISEVAKALSGIINAVDRDPDLNDEWWKGYRDGLQRALSAIRRANRNAKRKAGPRD